MNAQVKSKVLAAGSNDMSAVTWAETNKELEEGWMEIDPGQADNAAWAMRFGLQQKEKVRVIDDFSIAGVNQTTGITRGLKYLASTTVRRSLHIPWIRMEISITPGCWGRQLTCVVPISSLAYV